MTKHTHQSNRTIWIEKPDTDLQRVFTSAFPSYAGRKFKVSLMTGNHFNFTGAYWDGGSKSSYVVVDLATSRAIPASQICPTISNPSEYGGPTQPQADLPPNAVVVEHSMLCGNDMGLELHVPEANATIFLPTEVELTEQERIVLGITVNLKSFARREEAARSGITPAIWDTTKTALIERGFLRKNGAVTADGRNAVRDFQLY